MKRIWVVCCGVIWFGIGLVNAEAIQVDVEQTQPGHWQVNYQLPEPVNRVYFYRVGSLPRDAWHIHDAGLHLGQTTEGQDYIESASGEVFTRLSIGFASDFRVTPKDYELNFAFSDGGELLYTGHLLLALQPEAQTQQQFTFKTQSHLNIVVDGKVAQGKQTWLDQDLQGTYVYFGQNEPVQSGQVVGVIDAGLPQWIQRKLVSYLPKLFAFYTQETGLALDFTPVIYFSFKASEQAGTQYGGGVLPGLIQLNLVGQDWQQESPQNLTGLLHFLAHEAAHLWNAQLVTNDDQTSASWIHEGGADAFAVRALVHLGFWTNDEAQQAQLGYVNACLDALNGHAIVDQSGHQNFRVYYACGATIAWLSELAIQAQDSDLDLFDLWRDVMTRVRSMDLPLGSEQYFKSLMTHSQNPQLMIHILTWLTEPQAQPNDSMVETFATVGMKLQAHAKHPKQAKPMAEHNFRHLMRQDCQGYSYQRLPDAFVVGEGLTCSHLQSGMTVTHIMGLPVSTAGHAIAEKVRKQCASKHVVNLQMRDATTIKLPCQVSPPVVRPWLVRLD